MKSSLLYFAAADDIETPGLITSSPPVQAIPPSNSAAPTRTPKTQPVMQSTIGPSSTASSTRISPKTSSHMRRPGLCLKRWPRFPIRISSISTRRIRIMSSLRAGLMCPRLMRSMLSWCINGLLIALRDMVPPRSIRGIGRRGMSRILGVSVHDREAAIQYYKADVHIDWNGTMADFLKLNDYAIDAVLRALPTARVGGLEIAGGADGNYLSNYLTHAINGTNYATGKNRATSRLLIFPRPRRPSLDLRSQQHHNHHNDHLRPPKQHFNSKRHRQLHANEHLRPTFPARQRLRRRCFHTSIPEHADHTQRVGSRWLCWLHHPAIPAISRESAVRSLHCRVLHAGYGSGGKAQGQFGRHVDVGV